MDNETAQVGPEQTSPAAILNDKEAALKVIGSGSEDAGDYVAERQDQEDDARGDESVNTPARKAARLERYQRALAAQRDTASPQSAQPEQPRDTSEHSDPDERDSRIRREAEFGLRAREYLKDNPQAREAIGATFAVYQPADHVAEIVLRSELGPQIAHELAKNPEAIMDLNDLPPMEVARMIGIVEGRLRAERHIKDRETEMRATSRRVTRAPAPISPVTGGGSSPRSSIHELAKRDDISDYIKARNQEDARR